MPSIERRRSQQIIAHQVDAIGLLDEALAVSTIRKNAELRTLLTSARQAVVGANVRTCQVLFSGDHQSDLPAA
jgi:hypothetical protein